MLKDEIVGKEFKKKVSWESIDFHTGRPVVFDETLATDSERLVKAIQASTAIEGIFAPVHLDGMLLVDGGIYENVAIEEPIRRCLDDGVAPEDIIVDIILSLDGHVELKEWTSRTLVTKNALDIYRRSQI